MSPYDPMIDTTASLAQETTQDAFCQHTLGGVAQCTGVGVHSGEKATLRLLPAPADHGIVFFRTDLRNGARTIPARWDTVIDTQLCTMVGNDHGGKVGTIEHLMAALRASGIDNALIEVDGPEVPVMDGSASSFVFLIEMAGVQAQNARRREIVIRKPIALEHKNARVSLTPSANTHFTFDITFPSKAIQTQSYDFPLSRMGFKSEISRARTFGFFEEVEMLQKMGLGRGGSLENAIIVKGDDIMNEGGLRYGNEFVRHKLLDSIGDLALAGAPIRGHFTGSCSGHAMNNKLLHAMFADPESFCWMDAEEAQHLAD